MEAEFIKQIAGCIEVGDYNKAARLLHELSEGELVDMVANLAMCLEITMQERRNRVHGY